MSASLVGSEMCIRDRFGGVRWRSEALGGVRRRSEALGGARRRSEAFGGCLLYTSDAADDM
eukprot:11698627-Alexandrium_andersonii.AAC.1